MAKAARATLTCGQGGRKGGDGDREGRVSGYVLKVVRRAVSLTQEQFAERLGVDVTTVQGWESGRRPLMAVTAGTYLRLRRSLLGLGAPPPLLGQLDSAMEADRFIGYALACEGPGDNEVHPLATWVIDRPFTDLVGWAFTGTRPSVLMVYAAEQRYGPTPPGPQLAVDERNHIIGHLRDVAEQAAPDTETGALLRRQAHYVAGFDASPETGEWLALMQHDDERRLHSGRWTPSWPVVRSGAHTLARKGDGDALSRFIDVHIETDECETANLNYWAYWLGEISDPQVTDSFMVELDLGAWSGDRMLSHLVTKLDATNPYIDVVVHTLWSLITRKPEVVNPRSAEAASAAAARLLEQGSVSPQAVKELNEVLYALRMIHRW
ncbi:helix-turn-helix domain-containing protein [Nocardiopsis sp. RSe5-2]|uniref:Helix-turn-helix domain-containing protein n=1 Tax=Nocardiopsis endophytica TaxID=3018445 RepID=A0ABT4TY52_9ACTN|nr:helix-turn-helix domain-containing protein [Nocardiopsis endophytica]MDA2809624.1 helix-turn-helix domain-containing protein [Nocardiopsis endophytica]